MWGVRVGVRAGLGRWIWMLVKGSQTVRIKEEHGAARLRKARDLGLNFYLFFIFCCFMGCNTAFIIRIKEQM